MPWYRITAWERDSGRSDQEVRAGEPHGNRTRSGPLISQFPESSQETVAHASLLWRAPIWRPDPSSPPFEIAVKEELHDVGGILPR